MLFLISAIAFVLLLTGLILIHELGHFVAARMSRVTVEEFGFGLPPRVKSLFRWKGTLFSLNWIPFGGFVRLKGENAVSPEDRLAPGSFARAPFLARCVILIAGVLMNFLLAIALFTFGFSSGKWVPSYRSFEEMEAARARNEISLKVGVLIAEVQAGGLAATANVPAQSLLTAIDGKDVRSLDHVLTYQKGKSSVTYTVQTGKDFSKKVQIDVPVEDGKTGVSLRLFARDLSVPSRSVGAGFLLALRESWVVTVQTVIGLGSLVYSILTSASVPEGISGIVGIARLTYASVQEGFMMYLRLVALLSLSLAALNILPFPALDGGRLLFVVLGELWRKPSMRRIEVVVNSLGFIFLLFLILLVTLHDILRLFV